MNQELKNKTIENFIYAFSAQLISILLSTAMSLIIPKILGVEDFSYWQLFLFYITYVGFFHFGITDGMYLKNGGIDIDKIDKKKVSSQFYVLFFIQIIILSSILLFAKFFVSNKIRQFIFIFAAFYTLTANLNWFLGYIFQATNQIKKYSCSVIIDKLLFLFFIIIAYFIKFKNLVLYIAIYVLTTTIALIYSFYNARSIVFTRPYNIKKSLRVAFESAKTGIKLTLSNIASLLILGFGKFLVDKYWGITTFGKVSLALSLTNFFLLFISQVSMVLFPTLRKLDIKTTKNMYIKFNKYLNFILPCIYVVYIPVKLILTLWLPNYAISLQYLGILLPICIFDGKMQMVSNTYLKVLRKENKLLIFNLLSVAISIVLSLINVFVFKSIYLVIIGMLVAIAIRSIVSEIYLHHQLNIKVEFKNLIMIFLISILFIIYNIFANDIIAFILTLISYILYLYISNLYTCIFDIVKMLKVKFKHINNI